jgi:hypothetical protein
LELLKLRFGEARLHECEIMLQDMSESRRLNANINKTIQAKAPTGFQLLLTVPVYSGKPLTIPPPNAQMTLPEPCSIPPSYLLCSGLRYERTSLLYLRPSYSIRLLLSFAVWNGLIS